MDYIYLALYNSHLRWRSVTEFEIEKSVNGWLIALIIVGVLVLAGGVTVFILKRKEIIWE